MNSFNVEVTFKNLDNVHEIKAFIKCQNIESEEMDVTINTNGKIAKEIVKEGHFMCLSAMMENLGEITNQ
jgi:hypothetical protein